MEYTFNTKFKLGEVLYTLINKKITKVEVDCIEAIINIGYGDVSMINIKYSLILHDHTHKYIRDCPEEDLYKTKEELIKNL